MIVPYMSIDLFFVAAPFLCRSDRELAAFSKRIVAAIVVAGICFLLFPLRFAFGRPPASGWLGVVFDWFRAMDQPYNLLPSLHIAFRTILAQHYHRHTRGILRWTSNFWFVLVGLSTVLTYQHHLMDVVAGFALGVCCIYFIRESVPKLPVTENRRIGLYYAFGALILACLAFEFWPWGVLFLWPIMALLIVAAAYFGAGPIIFRKEDGRLHWSARLVLGPCLLGQQRLAALLSPSMPALGPVDAARLDWADAQPRRSRRRRAAGSDSRARSHGGIFRGRRPFARSTYRNIPILDLTAPSIEQLREMASFIDEESKQGIVYIHCKIGYSRTAAAAAAYLLQTGKASGVEEAIELLRQVRPTIVVRSECALSTRNPLRPRHPEPRRRRGTSHRQSRTTAFARREANALKTVALVCVTLSNCEVPRRLRGSG